jgi:hypothetical protein
MAADIMYEGVAIFAWALIIHIAAIQYPAVLWLDCFLKIIIDHHHVYKR